MAPMGTASRRCVLLVLAAVVLKGLILLILFLTIFRVRQPTARVVSSRLAGVAPSVTMIPPSFNINVTVVLTVTLHNPNRGSFAYDSGGRATLSYRGANVSDAGVDPGDVPGGSDATVQVALALQTERLAGETPWMMADVVKNGSVALGTTATVPGTVTWLGVFRRGVVAYSECQLVYEAAAMRVEMQECKDQAA